MRNAIACFLALAAAANAATYYVAPTGNNANPGSEGSPWLTIQYAITNAAAGDTVNIAAGTYNEFLTNITSGTAGNPITFQGTRGAAGEWLTIIDPSTPFTNGWVAAPEIGDGVYKQEGMSFETRELTIGNKRVAFVYTNGLMSSAIDSAYSSSGLSNGVQFLTLSSGAILTNVNNGYRSTTFWDGVEALYGTVSNATFTTYLRLRDGSDPNGLDIRCAPNRNGYQFSGIYAPAVKIESKNYLTYRNLRVRGAITGFFLDYANNCIFESNRVENGFARIYIGTSCSNNVVRFNDSTTAYYGYTNTGAWGTSTNPVHVIRANLYCVSKFLMGQSSSFDEDIYLNNAGNSNVITGNHVFDSLGTGIGVYHETYTGNLPMQGTVISSNTVERMTSIGVLISEGNTQIKVFRNTVSDCNDNARLHHLNASGETNRVVYLYRNAFWLPDGVGNHMEASFYTGDACTYSPEFWIYNNSFSGGSRGLVIGIVNADLGIQNLSGFRLLNNIFSGMTSYIGNVGIGHWTNATLVGAFDYNERTPPLLTYPASTNAAWMGANNITAEAAEWGLDGRPTFVLTAGSPAIGAAVDMGTTYPGTPDSETKVGSAWDMGAYEYNSARYTHTHGSGTLGSSTR